MLLSNRTQVFVVDQSIVIVIDARGGNHIPSSVGDVRSHWVDTTLFKQNRVVFDTSPSPDKAKLKIFNVSESDDGLYRCRVDFKTSQTRTSRLNLTVVGKKLTVSCNYTKLDIIYYTTIYIYIYIYSNKLRYFM